MRTIVFVNFVQLNMLTWLDKASSPVDHEASLAPAAHGHWLVSHRSAHWHRTRIQVGVCRQLL